MKTKIIITLVLLISLNIYSQESSKKASNTGIKGGYSLASVAFDGEGETGQRHGFHVGFYGESFLNSNIALQIELMYAQQGYEIKDNGGTFTQKLNYINLPLLLKIYPSDNFYIESGPQIGYAITHKEEFDSSFDLFDTSQEFSPNSFDYGVNFGAGFKTDSGVSFGLRYHLGLGDIYDEGKPKNRVWMFSLGFDL